LSLLVHGWGLVLRRAFHDRLVVLAAFATVVLATALLAAVPIYGDAVTLSGLRSELAQAPAEQAGVRIVGAPAADEDATALDRTVTAVAESTFAATGVRVFRSGESGSFGARGHGERSFAIGFREGVAAHARLLGGRFGAPSTGGTLGVAAEQGSGLRLGERLSLTSRLDGRRLRAQVTGIFQRLDPGSVFWGGDDADTVTLLVPPPQLAAAGLDGSSFAWRLAPRFDRLQAGELPELRQQVDALEARLNAGRPAGRQLAVYTRIGGVLAEAAASLRSTRANVLVPSAQLAVLATYALLFTAGLLLERRTRSVEILRLRGGTPGEIVVMSLMEAVLIALPAAAVAPWLAALLLRALNVVGPLASADLSLRPEVGLGAYGLAFAAAAVATLALTVPVLRARHVAVAETQRRLPLQGLAQRTHLDLALAALALLGYWQLRRYRAPLLRSDGGAQLDPFLIAAPALLLLAGSLVALRLVPLAAGLADRALSSTRGIVGALSPAQLARRPRRYTRAGLLLVLAVAIGIFAAAYAETWKRSQLDRSAYRAGADVRVVPSGADTAPPPIALAAGYRSLGGVSSLSPVVRQDVDYTGTGAGGSFLALDAARLPELANVRRDFAPLPLAELARRLRSGGSDLPSLALPGRPTRLRLALGFSSHGKVVAAPRVPFGGPRPLRADLFLSLRDRAGLVHQLRLGDPAQGSVTVDLVPRGSSFRPDYPLSLVSLQLAVDLPTSGSQTIHFSVDSLEVDGPRGRRPVPLGAADWHASAEAPRDVFRAPRVVGVGSAGGRLAARLVSGSGERSFFSRNVTADFTFRPGAQPPATALPVLASDAYLAATGARVGEAVDLPLGSGRYPARIVGSVHRFPTADPAAPLVIADLPSFEQAALRIERTGYQPDEWWLATRGDGAAAADRLSGPPWSSLEVVSRAELARQLRDDPLSLGTIGALALGFVVAAAFAALGFALAAAISARQRLGEFAVLRSLGVSARELAAVVLVENGLLIALSLAAGTGLGLGVAWLVLPFLSLDAAGAAAVPPVVVSVPWLTIMWIELALVVALLGIAALHVRRVSRLSPAPTLRAAGSEAGG
jgi:hypothetical protein